MGQGFARQNNNTTTGTGAPNFTPAFVGQEYIDSQTGSIYKAMGTSGAYNWAYIGRGATSAFNKDTVPGLVGWWDATMTDYVTKDAGNNVTAFYDMSDGAKNFVNSSATKPVWTENVFGTLPGIYFGGAAYLYTNSFTAIGQPNTYFIVIKPTAWSTGTNQDIIGGHEAGGGAYNGQVIGKATSNLNVYLHGRPSSAQGPALTNTTPVLLTCTFNGSSSSIAINDNAPVTLIIGSSGIDNLYLGTAPYGSPYTGYFGAGMLFSSTLSDANKAIVRTMLNNKFALF